MPPNAEVATNLKRLGVIYERGVVPIYYLPNERTATGDSRAMVALTRILEEYPVKTEAEAEPSPAYRPSFSKVPDTPDDIEFFHQAAGTVGEDGSREVHLYLNEPATQLLTQVIRSAFPAENTPRFDGITLRIRRANYLADLCYKTSLIAQNRLRPAFRLLADLLREAIGKDTHAITVVNADARRSAQNIRITEEEEAFHRAVIKATDGKPLTADEADGFLKSTSFIEEASQRLRTMQPHLKYSQDVAEELAAIVRNGEWAKLGLSDAEAKATWDGFIKTAAANADRQPEILHRYAHVHHASQEPGTEILPEAHEVSGAGAGEERKRQHDEDSSTENTSSSYRPSAPGSGEPPPRRDVTLGSGLGGLQDPLAKLYRKDIVPTAKAISRRLRGALDDFQKAFAPQTRGVGGEPNAHVGETGREP